MTGMAATRQTKTCGMAGRKAVLFGIVVTVILAAAALLIAGCSDRVSEARDAELAGDLKTAEALYLEQLQSDPDDLAAVKGLAEILYLERRWDEALPFQKKAITLDTKEAQIRVELGFNYLNHQNAPAEAVTVFQEASMIEPTAQYLSFLAQAQLATGDKGAVEATLRDALDADKTYSRAYMLLISFLEEQGRTAEVASVRAEAEAEGVSLDSSVTTP
jgi:tetratricopeptide (TPR) repeat protein